MVKKIKGYNYTISDKGEVVNTVTGKKQRWQKNSKGYNQVTLVKDGVDKKFYVQRLVAEYFGKGGGKGKQAHHKDKDKDNNKTTNMMWVSPQDNIKDEFGRRMASEMQKARKDYIS